MEDALKLLTGYLLSLPKENIPRARECIGEQFIEIGMSLLTRSDFYLSKMHQRKLFRSVLCIFNFLLRNDNNLIYSRLFYRIFQENSLSYKFLDFLKQATQSLINRRDSDNVLQQINSCLSDMCLCV